MIVWGYYMTDSGFQSNQPSDVQVVISSLNRLIDGITPALTRLNSVPTVLETVDKRLDTIHKDLVVLKESVDSHQLDMDYISDVISDVETLRESLDRYITVFEEFNKTQQEAVEYKKTVSKLRWEFYSKVALYVLGSGGALMLILQALFSILGIEVSG